MEPVISDLLFCKQEKKRYIDPNRRKTEAITHDVFGFAYVFYILKSHHPFLNINRDFINSPTYNKKYDQLPYCVIEHTRSYIEHKHSRLIEYLTIHLWAIKDKQNIAKLQEVIDTIDKQFWKPRLKNEEFIEIADNEGMRYIKINISLKTSTVVNRT